MFLSYVFMVLFILLGIIMTAVPDLFVEMTKMSNYANQQGIEVMKKRFRILGIGLIVIFSFSLIYMIILFA